MSDVITHKPRRPKATKVKAKKLSGNNKDGIYFAFKTTERFNDFDFSGLEKFVLTDTTVNPDSFLFTNAHDPSKDIYNNPNGFDCKATPPENFDPADFIEKR